MQDRITKRAQKELSKHKLVPSLIKKIQSHEAAIHPSCHDVINLAPPTLNPISSLHDPYESFQPRPPSSLLDFRVEHSDGKIGAINKINIKQNLINNQGISKPLRLFQDNLEPYSTSSPCSQSPSDQSMHCPTSDRSNSSASMNPESLPESSDNFKIPSASSDT